MPRWFVTLCLGASALFAFACNDELVEEGLPKDVCYSGMRWVGEKRGSPEMYPGRDCVGCHIDNDGPPLALGGTIYPYVLGREQALAAQSGEDCFGIEGITITIEDAEGQIFELTTNRAGNFYLEGNPDDFAKPFSAAILGWGINPNGTLRDSRMATAPMYGGCARCHDPSVPPGTTPDAFEPTTADVRNGTARIGLPGYRPGNSSDPEVPTVEQELRALIEAEEGEEE